jgi:mannose-6-phosphate isomerase-like protein (cupin superfamily)
MSAFGRPHRAGMDVDLRAIRRVVSSLDEQGRSTVVIDEVSPHVKASSTTAGVTFTEIWATPSAPPSRERVTDGSLDAPGPADPDPYAPRDPRGTLCRVVCHPPDREGAPIGEAMHATRTVDYVLILSGTITAIYEDGTEVELLPGDIVVQRGVRHTWANRGEDPCIFMAVLVGAPDHP